MDRLGGVAPFDRTACAPSDAVSSATAEKRARPHERSARADP
jgi:hypothetical protein